MFNSSAAMTVYALLHVVFILTMGVYSSIADAGLFANHLEIHPSRTLQEVWFGHELMRFFNRIHACLLMQYGSKPDLLIQTPAASWGKHGYTCLAVPGHDPPIDLTISKMFPKTRVQLSQWTTSTK